MNRPFDCARYEALLEGLECSEVQFSKLAAEGTNRRIDSEYFSKRFLENVTLLQNNAFTKESLAKVTTKIDVGYVGPMVQAYTKTGVPLLQTQNIKQFLVDYSDCIHITSEFHAALQKSQLFPGDCLIARSGSIGNAAFVLEGDPQPLNSADIIIVRADQQKITNGYLACFLNAKFGALQIEQLTSGGVQGHINLKTIEHIIVPLLSKKLQMNVDAAVRCGMTMFRDANKVYQEAEQTLLRALGLEGWQPPEPLTYTRRASESFSAQRFDAEYFQPKFEALKQHIKDQGECLQLGDLLTFCQRGKQPEYAESGLPVINSKHVRNGTVMMDEANRLARPAENGLKILQRDVLINGTGVGTIGRAAAYLNDSPALPDNHVTILRLRKDADIDPVFLAVQLNSLIGQMQVDQYFKGSSGQIELYPSDIEAFSIWKAPIKTQQAIRQNIDAVHAARREASALLDRAKRVVEVAIEESEAAALALLNTTERL